VKTGFGTAVKLSKLSLEEGPISPHTLRHTAATWLMQRRADPWQAAGFLGMPLKVLLDTYGHHHPDYMREAATAITAKDRNQNVAVVETVVDLSRARENSKSPCDCWWARQDSNLQPDRYERPALTIELQAPPRAAVRDGRQRCGHPLQCAR